MVESSTAPLFIVDVQDCFAPHCTTEFVDHVFNTAKEYSEVYQVWDSIDASEPCYTFPNQVSAVEKEYGYDPCDDDIDGPHRVDGQLAVPTPGDHQWFLVPEELESTLRRFSGKCVHVIGGADGECLEDILAAMRHLGVDATVIASYRFAG